MLPNRRNFACYYLMVFIVLGASHSAVAQPRTGQPGQSPANDAVKPGGNAPVPTGESTRAIALTVWALTIKESTGPEAGELEGALRDKANHLPAAVGTQKEVRDMIAKLKVAGLLHKFREIRLLTVAGETAPAMAGIDQPVIQSTNFSPMGTMNSTMFRSMGTIVEAKPIIDSDGLIQVGLTYESSFLDDAHGVVIAEVKDKEPIRAPAIARKNTTTLVRLESGNAVLVSSDAIQDPSEKTNPGQVDLLILAAETVGSN